MARLFRRVTNSWRVPCDDQASQVLVGKAMLRSLSVNAFVAVNTSPYWVRLMGSKPEEEGGFKPVEDYKGWIIAPGHSIEYETQYPEYVSGIAVERPGYEFSDDVPFGELELYYGYLS